MPSLKDIKKRIGSVKNTQKITRAMKLVAAAKLRRAQEGIIAARPYSDSLERVVSELVTRSLADSDQENQHPLLTTREVKSAEIVLLTSDRGLAGSFNAQIIRGVEQYAANSLSHCSDVHLRILGSKGNDYFKRRSAKILASAPAPTSQTALAVAREQAALAIEDFLEGRVDEVYLAYNEFRSAVSQDVIIKRILPIEGSAEEAVDGDANDNELKAKDFIYEPSQTALIDHLLPLFVQVGMYRAALESIASEFGARMSAMDSATRNAGDMISKLTLQYNRARQAAITKELLEIISGAEALKG